MASQIIAQQDAAKEKSMSLGFKCSVLMLVYFAKLPGFVAVILCKEEFLILGVFFLVLWAILYFFYWLLVPHSQEMD